MINIKKNLYNKLYDFFEIVQKFNLNYKISKLSNYLNKRILKCCDFLGASWLRLHLPMQPCGFHPRSGL